MKRRGKKIKNSALCFHLERKEKGKAGGEGKGE